jgi:hypothetical protein
MISVPAMAAALGSPSTRVDRMSGMFPLLAPDAASLPYIVTQQIIAQPVYTLDGVNRFCTSRWSFNCYSSPYKATKIFAKIVKDVMTGVPLGVSLPPVGPAAHNNISIVVQCVVPVMLDIESMEEIPHGTIFSIRHDFVICYIDNEG